MTTLNTILFILTFGNAMYMAYLLGEVREARRQHKIQDELTDRLVAAYRAQR
jgi:hypothetical protein